MNLQRGSRGEAVKTLQTFLGLKPDGIFGSITEEAVKEYQINHALVPDGIVGKRTWASMGLAATDNSERPDIVNEAGQEKPLDIKTSYLPKGQYVDAQVKKSWAHCCQPLHIRKRNEKGHHRLLDDAPLG